MSAHTEITVDPESGYRIEAAARFLAEQHGENAIAEAEQALRQANEIKDEMAVQAFEAILALLRSNLGT